MTSKEALDLMVKEYYNIVNLPKEKFLELGVIVEKDLERWEALNKVWHKNEVMESVDINAEHLQELYDYISKINQENQHLKTTNEALNEMMLQASNEAIKVEQENEILKMSVKDTYDTSQEIIGDLTQENEKLKKVIEIYKKISFIDKESTTSYLVRNGIITQQEYELLKEVLGK